MRFHTTARAFLLLIVAMVAVAADAPQGSSAETVQAQVVLTVAEGKRLIAKAVAAMPEVKQARAEGTLIITKGTTNTYVAEEVTGEAMPHGPFVYGRTYPSKGGDKLADLEPVSEVVYVKGKRRKNVPLDEAVQELAPGDVVIKGANALDYANKTAGVCIGSPTGGTSGTIMPYVVARKAHLIIPIGLEKQTVLPVMDAQLMMREPMESLNDIPSMFLLTGTIVTELEALDILTGVSAHQICAGGIGGAEGAVRLIVRGSRGQVKAALKLVESIHGEPPFVTED
ncbi:MAG: hypothetical protein GY851_26355 [bacterium]|nr:hypothetical protein [bacterium]